MRSRPLLWFALASMSLAFPTYSQMIRPPAFIGGIPGVAQFQAIQMQRHQARTLLYREALEELRKNPAAADVPECAAGQNPKGGQCLARPDAATAAALIPAATAIPSAAVPTASAPKPAAETVAAAPPDATIRAAQGAASPVRRRFAVLVGNNAYAAPIPPLETPIADVSQIASVLQTRFGFEIQIVRDAGKTKLIEALNNIAAEARPEDAVLIMYAGHGYLMEDINMGYWIPVDASVKTAKGWISNSDISKLLSAIPARQLILISDSCYSGSLTKEQKVTQGRELKADDILKQRSVMVFSSGADEPVSDEGKEGHSIFAWNLIKTLKNAGTLTPGAQVWSVVNKDVSKEYPQQPQYGAVVSAGHNEGGDFLFQVAK